MKFASEDLRWLEVLPQPDDTTCGPTCLHAVYRYFGEDRELDDIIREVTPLETGGTLSVLLACHALEHGYEAKIYSFNLQIFDPSWFSSKVVLEDKLRAQLDRKKDPKLALATEAYLRFLELGGEVRHRELSEELLVRYLDRGIPILTGLSATYLYDCPREREDNQYDDVAGHPTGHFVVICGYDAKTATVRIADPLPNNPRFGAPYYDVSRERLKSAILLGIVTYDANLLILEPKKG